MNKNRKYLFFFFFSAIALVFIARLFYIQVIKDEYKLSAANNVVRKEKIYPGRGFIYDRNGKLLVGNQSAYDLMVIPRMVKDIDTSRFCALLRIDKSDFTERMQKAKEYSYIRESVFIKQLSREQFAYLQEVLHHYPGFFPQKRILRTYPHKAGANVVGFIGEANDYFLEKNPSYSKGDLVGITGIEKSYENELRGRAGIAFKMVDVHNSTKGRFQEGEYDTLPQPGKDVISTIDIELQKYGELLMTGKRGSIVAIEPATGEILSLVTAPSYDPELMIGRERSRNYSRLYLDSINKPLFDRGLLAEYPPGSPFKVINALIGLQEGTLTPSTSYTCHHGFHYRSLHVACHCGTNYPIALRTAISKSCNNYFCTVFKHAVEKYDNAQLGLDAWSKHVKSFGLGQYLNNDLPTGRPGFVPTASYYTGVDGGTNWRAVRAISLGIGQGELVLTPIQMANFTATIANRGWYITPHIVKKVGDTKIEDEQLTKPKYTSIEPGHFETVVNGMFDVFEYGTARGSRLEGIEMCGKTGTAQNPHGQNHSIFVVFAPRKEPKIAIAIIVENGYWGSRWAAPIASLMVEKYLTGEVSRLPLEKRMTEGSLADEYEEQFKKKYMPEPKLAVN